MQMLVHFYRKFSVFPIFSVFSFFRFFVFLVFRMFRFYTETESFDVSIEPKTHQNSLKESLFGYFSENLGLFRFGFFDTVLFVSVVSI